MPKRTRPYRETKLKRLKNVQEAAAYLNAALEESYEDFIIALRDVAESHRISTVASTAGVKRESVYRMLSESGNPTFYSLTGILKAVGLKLSIAFDPADHETAPHSPPLLADRHGYLGAGAGTLTSTGRGQQPEPTQAQYPQFKEDLHRALLPLQGIDPLLSKTRFWRCCFGQARDASQITFSPALALKPR